jgi:hypothetical protein
MKAAEDYGPALERDTGEIEEKMHGRAQRFGKKGKRHSKRRGRRKGRR